MGLTGENNQGHFDLEQKTVKDQEPTTMQFPRGRSCTQGNISIARYETTLVFFLRPGSVLQGGVSCIN
jgi:hypothetical protein